MIVGSTVEDLEIPHEPGNKIGIRQLSGLEMDEASGISSQKSMKRLGGIGTEALQAIRAGRVDEPTTTIEIEDDPINDYDHEFLIVHAVVRWSGPYYDMECNEANKRLLDEPTLKWLVKEIVNRNHVPLVKLETSTVSTTEGFSHEN